MFKHIIDLFQTVNLSREVTTELTGVLLNEVPSNVLLHVIDVADVHNMYSAPDLLEPTAAFCIMMLLCSVKNFQIST